MQIHTLNLFPKPGLTITTKPSSLNGVPMIKIGDDDVTSGITIFLMHDWDAEFLFNLAGQLVDAGRSLAAAAGQAQLAEGQEAV